MMKKQIYFSVLTLSILCISVTAYSQFGILKKVGKETERKVKRGAEDMIVDKVSDELSRRLLKSIDKATDDMLRDAYRREHGDEYSDEQIDSIIASNGADFSKFVLAMDKYDELPDSYEFDVIMDVETKDFDKKKYDMVMYFSGVRPIFAMKQIEDGREMYLVMDNEKDLIAVFSEEDGKKVVQAYSSTMLGSSFNQNSSSKGSTGHDRNDDGSFMGALKVTKTGKTKKILGYSSYEIKAEGEEAEFKAYFSEEVPINWSMVFSPMMQKMAADCFNENYKELNGAMLENESKRKEDGKKATWETKKIILDKIFTLLKKDYKSSTQANK